jgi:hypothetical protein
MEIKFFGVRNDSVQIEDKNKTMVGSYSVSPNGKNMVVFCKSLNLSAKEYNLGIVNNKSLIKIARINRPVSAVITDDGNVAVAAITNEEEFTFGLEFYDPTGKKIKTLKGYGQKLYLSPDSKFLISQAMSVKDDPDRNRELNVYDMTTLKKVITTINPLWEKRVFFDTEKQTVTFERDDEAPALWISATMSLRINK